MGQLSRLKNALKRKKQLQVLSPEKEDNKENEDVSLEEVLRQNKSIDVESSPKDDCRPNISFTASTSPNTQLVPFDLPRNNPYASRLSHPAYTMAPHPQCNVPRKPIATPRDNNDLYEDVVKLLNKASTQNKSPPSSNSILVARFLICLGMLIAYPMAGILLFVMFFGLELYLNQDPPS